MSSYTPPGFYRGCKVLIDGKEKTVANWHFVAESGYWAGLHNSDVIVVKFTDGTVHKGWSGISTPDDPLP